MSVGPRKPARFPGLLRRGIAALMLTLLIGAAVLWWFWCRWEPSREAYPVQGVAVSSTQGEINWAGIRAQGADFAYIHVSTGTKARDATFPANWAGARAAGLRYGAELIYDPCTLASDQATLFITTVPRDTAALPPAIRLGDVPGCAPGRDRVLSELNTLVNLVESHAGKPVLLHISPAFERAYRISEGVDRTLWLDGNFLPPEYAARDWVMWTASNGRRFDAIAGPVQWVAVAP